MKKIITLIALVASPLAHADMVQTLQCGAHEWQSVAYPTEIEREMCEALKQCVQTDDRKALEQIRKDIRAVEANIRYANLPPAKILRRLKFARVGKSLPSKCLPARQE